MLERTVQDHKCNCRKFIHDGVTSRYVPAKSFEWSVFEEILSKVCGKMLELL
jgi:hypothetical protein